MGLAVVGGGRIKSGTSGFVGGINTVDPRSGFAVIGAAIPDPRHDREPSKIRVRKRQLMERVKAVGAIVLYTRVLGELRRRFANPVSPS